MIGLLQKRPIPSHQIKGSSASRRGGRGYDDFECCYVVFGTSQQIMKVILVMQS